MAGKIRQTHRFLFALIFRDVMMIGGNAIDSAIAALLCVGVVNPQSSGIGGGFLMTIFNRSDNNKENLSPATIQLSAHCSFGY